MTDASITVDPTTLTPTSIEVMANQATINIGTIGHVAHGKSTLVKAISGVQTVRFKNELERNITIKLGYANAKIYKCDSPDCPRPGCYKSYGSSKEVEFPCERVGCTGTMKLLRHVSFVDCFGLDTAFATAEGKSVLNRDLRVGDKLMGPDGQPRTILSMKEGEKDMYEVAYKTTRTNGLEEDKFTCTGGHLLCLRIDTPVDAPVFDRARGVYFVNQYLGKEKTMCSTQTTFDTMEQACSFYDAANKCPVEFEMTVESYLAVPESVRRKCRLYRASTLNFGAPEIDLTVGEASEEEVAWLIGLWLGNGDSNNTRITLNDSTGEENIKRITSIATKMGLATIVEKHADRNATWITLSTQSGPAKCDTECSNTLEENSFYRKLTELGIAGDKHVPSALQRHTVAIRHAVVAGVIDADGTCADGQFELEFSATTGDRLFHSMVWMIRSLGFVVHASRRSAIVEGVEHEKLCMQFNGHTADELPVASCRKIGSSLVRAWATSQQFTVKNLGPGPFRGFEVDGDGRVLLADFVVAHNCPGHDILMAVMLNGAAVMDAAMLLVAANESCPQPQTSEHLAAVEIMQLQNIIILQNKVDLIKEDQAIEHHQQICKFTKGTIAANAPIVPISAQLKFNIDAVVENIVKRIPIPVRDFTSDPHLIVIRSFDVNKPGAEIDELKGGVAGGSILKGVLKLGDEIEIRPGLVRKEGTSQITVRPIHSRILTLNTEQNHLKFAVPGGLIGVGTMVDPSLCRADRLVGQVLGHVGKLPKVYIELEINYFLLRRLLGVKTDDKKQAKVSKLSKSEVILVNIGSTSVGARVTGVKSDLAKLVLSNPSCTEIGEKIAMSRRIDKHWRLIGWAKIMKGKVYELEQN